MSCAVSVDARLNVNVALNRPSYQVSTKHDIFQASYANDGNRNTNIKTDDETNPWWAVDLGLGSGTVCVRRQIHQQTRKWYVSSVYSRTPSSGKKYKIREESIPFLPSPPPFPFYLTFLTLPFISFPSSSLHFFSSGHKEAPQIQLEDLAERCELPQQSPGQSPCHSGISVKFWF